LYWIDPAESFSTQLLEIGRFLQAGDLFVINETRVIPAAYSLEKYLVEARWSCSCCTRRINILGGTGRGKGLIPGKHLAVEGRLHAEITAILEGPRRLVRFTEPIEPYLDSIGHVPLPPYIHTPLANPERYQTVYARQPGSAAAPPPGCTLPRINRPAPAQGIAFTRVILHVGLDTFAPVTEVDPGQHAIHSEWCQVSPDAVMAVNKARQAGGRVIA